MERFAYQKLLFWKTSIRRKPLMLQGARQVGKSYLLESFGQREFEKYHVFNFEMDRRLARIFSQDLDPDKILAATSGEFVKFCFNTSKSYSFILQSSYHFSSVRLSFCMLNGIKK